MRYLFILLFVMLTACGATVPTVKPFKMDIQQGNVVSSKMLLQLRPGMTKSQVKFIMGSPLLIDSFHTNRWDYFYQLRQAGKIVEQRRVILDFDKDLLTKVRGDVVPEGTAGAATANESAVAKTITVEPKPKQETSWTDKLKFWKKDEIPKDGVAKDNVANDSVAKDMAKPEAATSESIMRDADKSNSNDALEANTGAPAGDAAINSAETSSILAVPIGGVLMPDAPAVDVPAEQPNVNAPVLEKPAAEEPVISPISERVTEAPPTEVAQSAKMEKPAEARNILTMPAGKAGERLIFRLDTNLNLKNLDVKNLDANNLGVSNQAVPVETLPTPKSENLKPNNNDVPTSTKAKKTVPALPKEDAPGYFERMLEKIGF